MGVRAILARTAPFRAAAVAAENTRRTIEHLRALVEARQQQTAEMAERLARYEHPKRPAIY